ncbi:hypothetical protein L7F22_019553 [Adiantum nelumboides]|nr:hypothetical protein [Adiantum nelumboides]
MTSASETEGEGSQAGGQKSNGNSSIPKSAKELAKMKGKGPAVSAFNVISPEIILCIPPVLMHDAQKAAEEQLDTLVMRYVPQFEGVLMSHSNLKFKQRLGKIDGDGAFANVLVGVSGRVWAPKIGMRLEGKIKLSTPSHVSLLVHGTFNASITSGHLPSIQEMAHMPRENGFEWQEFSEDEYEDVAMEDPAEKSSEEPVDGENPVETESGEPNDELPTNGEEVGEKSTGCWIDKKTGERLGGKTGTVTFTVVGITIANHMISIHGSLLRKPFSIPAPTYVPNSSSLSSQKQNYSATSNQNSTESRRVRFGGHQTSEFAPYEDSDSDDDDSDVEESHFDSANVSQNIVVESSSEKSNKKKRSKVGPKLEGETSESEGEGDSGREKKKRRKSSK